MTLDRMVILALDTSSRAGSMALWRDGDVVACRAGEPALTHAERLPSDLVALLAARGLAPADVDLFAVAAGPGSFTGLRVGIATVQGLAFAHNRLVVPVSTLDALAVLGRDPVAPALIATWIDAQRHEVFSALYGTERTGEASVLDAPAVAAPLATLDRWQPLIQGRGVRFIGDGAAAYWSLIASRSGADVALVDPLPPLAPAIARIAATRAAQDGGVPPHAIRPIYVRRPDAELARDRRAAEA